VWHGLSTEHVRAGLDRHITLEQLRHAWMPISPWPFIERVKTRKDSADLRAVRSDVSGRSVAQAS
jgi:hypothetical protein